MNIYWLTLCLLMFGFCRETQCSKKFMGSNIQQLETKILKSEPVEIYHYYEDWSCGEVQWEFAKDIDSQTYTIVVPKKNFRKVYPRIYEKTPYFGLTSGIVKVLYDDFVKIETVLYQMENVDIMNYASEGSLADIISLTFLGAITYLYKNSVKVEMNILRKQKLEISHKPITLQEIQHYLRFQKLVKSFAFVFLFIFTKNVKNAE